MVELLSEKTSVWQTLQNANKPILIYGMGDGALKILRIFDDYNIKISGFFASDEFVRGHSFCGFKVLTYAQAKEQFEDFIIILAFASLREPMLEHLKLLNNSHELYAPDVPVIMESNEVFDCQYVQKHIKSLTTVYQNLADDLSKRTFIDIINFKISGKIDYLFAVSSPISEMYTNIINPKNDEIYIDLGAYNGDTLTEFLTYSGGACTKAICFEPDKNNFKKLINKVQKLGLNNCDCYNIGAWRNEDTLLFSSKSGRNSTLSQNGQITILVNSVDNVIKDVNATTIKLDVEGAELMALLGAQKAIMQSKPKLMVSAYHKNEDIFELPLLIKQLNPEYKIFLRHHPYIPAWETNYYAI